MSNDCCTADGNTEAYVSRCIEEFKREGGRMTMPRRAVFRILAEAKEPVSVQEIHALTGGNLGLDKVTVYRIVEKLLELNLVHYVGNQGKLVPCLHDHSRLHLICQCTSCEAVTEVQMPMRLENGLIELVQEAFGSVLFEQPISVSGKCIKCS